MRKYRVRVERDQMEVGYVEFWANSKTGAMDKAPKIAMKKPIEWESCGKGGATDPYNVSDEDSVEVIK